MVSMNRLPREKRRAVIAALVEGNSIRATIRMTGVAKNTVTKLLVDLGFFCSEYQNEVMTGLTCQRIQCDEIWAYCYAKAKNVPEEHEGTFGYGDVWTWTAIDADTKLVPCWLVGERTYEDAFVFMSDLAGRLANQVQLTSDGYHPHLVAVDDVFGGEVDFAMLRRIYGTDPKADKTKYSPAKCIGVEVRSISGEPDPAHISTSYVERQNLTMRMGMRRFTRLTNAFSKKIENLAHAVSLHFMHYNFCRPHKSLKGRTPAMAAGLTDHVWSLDEIIGLLEQTETSEIFKLTHYRESGDFCIESSHVRVSDRSGGCPPRR
jgi:IS1 family transposase